MTEFPIRMLCAQNWKTRLGIGKHRDSVHSQETYVNISGGFAMIKGLWSYLTAGPACSGFLAVRKGKRGVEGWWLWGALCGQKCTPLAVHCSEPPPPPLLSRWKLRHLMLRRLILRWSVAYVCVCARMTCVFQISKVRTTQPSVRSQWALKKAN